VKEGASVAFTLGTLKSAVTPEEKPDELE